jgi:hypothetical protein
MRREAASSLDEVSDHLGEVLRRADELLAEWSRFGAEVRAQVDREVATIGEVVDGAVARAANAGLDRAIADRLRGLTTELDRLEQRIRAASRATAERRERDRGVLWAVVAGIVLANALLVALLLRRPDTAPVAEPIRIEAPAAEATPPSGPAQGKAPAVGPGDTAPPVATGSATQSSEATPPVPSVGSNAGSNAPSPAGTATPAEAAGQTKPTASPIAPPPRGGNPRPHKKLP